MIVNEIKTAAGLALCIVILIPLVGAFVDGIISRLLRALLNIFGGGGNAYYVFINFLTFPGVMYHEFAHALFAVITGAKLVEVALFRPTGLSLGHVTYRTRGPHIMCSLQRSFSSCAPVIMGLIGEYYLVNLLLAHKTQGFTTFLVSYLVISIGVHMEMSLADLWGYLKGSPVFYLFWLILLAAIFYYTGIPNLSSLYELIQTLKNSIIS